MKKILALALVLVMVFALCACGSASQGKKDDDSGFKVGFIFLHDENSTYDANFINAANAACANLGVTGILKTNVPEGQECYEAAAELVDAGCSVIFADSFGHED
jgi:basic membrane protein A